MTHDALTGAPAGGPRSTSLRLPPQVQPVDRTHSSAGALTDRSDVQAARESWWLDPDTDWVLNHSTLPRPMQVFGDL